MFDVSPCTPSKRKCSDEADSHREDKKLKLGLSPRSQPTAKFWDNLSKIDLTKAALKELDQRNSQHLSNAIGSPSSKRRCLITRRSVVTHTSSSSLVALPTVFSQELKRFARHGGPDLSQLRGFPRRHCLTGAEMSSRQSRSRGRKRESKSISKSRGISSPNTTSTKSTGPYNRNFQQNLIDGGVYPHMYRYPDGQVPPKPDNWDEINLRLAQPRCSLSPSRFPEEAHQKFIQADADAMKEKQVCVSVIPIIEGHVTDSRCTSGGIPFTNLEHLTDGTLVPGNPDIYYGARPEQLDRRIREELSTLVVPSTQEDLPILPNFVLAAKGPDGSLAVAGRQATYDGGFGARSMHAVQSYKAVDETYDKKAYTITSIYHGGTLKMFTSHPFLRKLTAGGPEYATTQLRSFAMTDTAETFRQGATYYRNGRDWAREQRDQAIWEANSRARELQAPQNDSTSTFPSKSPSEESATEILSQDISGNGISDTTFNASAVSGEANTRMGLKGKRAHRLSREIDNSERKRQYPGSS